MKEVMDWIYMIVIIDISKINDTFKFLRRIKFRWNCINVEYVTRYFNDSC